jgi:hypothetical protein
MKRIRFARIISRITVGLIVTGFGLLPQTALAAFHLMEIEQIVGGVGGDNTAQAVQLRMRFFGQNVLNPNGAQLVVRDAAGANPVVLSTFPGPNPGDPTACRRILLVTPSMVAKTTPAVTGAYTMAAIPPSYLAGGSMTFESPGAIWWRTSWGTYAGPGTGVTGGAAVLVNNAQASFTVTPPPPPVPVFPTITD